MNSKTFYIFIFCIITTFQLNAQDLYVWASQLNLRAAPNGKIISRIPWGEKIKVIERFTPESFDTLSLKIEYTYWENILNKPYSLWGEWIKVEVGQQIGYTFDAYLSKIPPPERRKNNRFEALEEYFEREFGVSNKEKIGGEGGDDYYQRLVSKDESIELEIGIKGKGGITEFIFHNLSIKEGKLIGYQLFRHYISGACDFSVYEKEKKVIVEGFCSC